MAGAERRHSGTLSDPEGEVHQLSGWFPCKVPDRFQAGLATYRMNRSRTTELTNAISHPARRSVLRGLHGQSGPCSLPELARDAGLSLPSADYHLRVLQGCGATHPIPEVTGRTLSHQSTVSEHQWVRAQLAATAADDDRAAGRTVDERPRKAI
jgi:DNA-binding transcriptional ArsR family regulator